MTSWLLRLSPLDHWAAAGKKALEESSHPTVSTLAGLFLDALPPSPVLLSSRVD